MFYLAERMLTAICENYCACNCFHVLLFCMLPPSSFHLLNKRKREPKDKNKTKERREEKMIKETNEKASNFEEH